MSIIRLVHWHEVQHDEDNHLDEFPNSLEVDTIVCYNLHNATIKRELLHPSIIGRYMCIYHGNDTFFFFFSQVKYK